MHAPCLQELGVLLRAANLRIAQPRNFLLTLSRIITQHPEATAAWDAHDCIQLHSTLQLISLPPLPATQAAAPNAAHPQYNNAPMPASNAFATAAQHMSRETTGSSKEPLLLLTSSAPQPIIQRLLTDTCANSTRSFIDTDRQQPSPGVLASSQYMSASPALPQALTGPPFVANAPGMGLAAAPGLPQNQNFRREWPLVSAT